MVLSLLPPVHLQHVLREVLDEEDSCPRTACGPCPRPPRRALPGSTSAASTASWTTSPANRPSNLFGGNSNWRGPVWFPLNYLFIESLLHWDDGSAPISPIEYPTGSGERLTLRDVAGARASARGHLAARRRAPAGPRRDRRSSATTRNGATCCCSTSTSMATRVPAWVPRTRPAGPVSWHTCCVAGARLTSPPRWGGLTEGARIPGGGLIAEDAYQESPGRHSQLSRSPSSAAATQGAATPSRRRPRRCAVTSPSAVRS